MADGDAVSIFGSSHIWVDHNSLSNCADGLVDAVMGSTAITVSNNHFTHHNEVGLLLVLVLSMLLIFLVDGS
jgi:pectate lyase